MKFRLLRSVILVKGCFLAAGLLAQEGLEDLEQPSDSFLEFLGAWEAADGEWLAPQDILAIAPPNTDEVEVVDEAEIEADIEVK